MKKLLYLLLAIPALLFASCQEEMGTKPGTDKAPHVVIYKYDLTDKSLNPDNDIRVRFATTEQTTDVYYLVELASKAQEEIDSLGKVYYSNKIKEQGVKVPVEGNHNLEMNITGIFGKCYVSAVGVDAAGAVSTFTRVEFEGLSWNKVCEGTFTPNVANFPETTTVLEVASTNPSLFRVKDALGAGNSLKFTTMANQTYTDADGLKYTLVRIPKATVGWTVQLTDGNTYPVWVFDIATWQNNASYATSEDFCSLKYEDNYCLFNLAWMCDKGCFGYGSFSGGKTSVFSPL